MKTKDIHLKNKKLKIFLSRLLLIYGLHLIIKWGDETFHHFFDFTLRGIYFSTFVIILWMTCIYLLDYLKKKWFVSRKQPYTYLGFCIAYGYIFALITNIVYRYVDTNYFETDWGDIGYFNPMLILGILVLFISALSFNEYFQAELSAKESQILTEKLKKENAIAHYKLLQTQIEPHFLFNSLSVLSSLVHQDTGLSSDFIIRLSRLLRFSMTWNEQMFVPLKEEVDFMLDYFFLMQTRFGNSSITLRNNICIPSTKDFFLPPGTLQTLMENVIKHNSHSLEIPLTVYLYNDEKFIYFGNNIVYKSKKINSTGIGLKNLSQRFTLLCGKGITYNIQKNNFVVRLPVITKNILHAHINY